MMQALSTESVESILEYNEVSESSAKLRRLSVSPLPIVRIEMVAASPSKSPSPVQSIDTTLLTVPTSRLKERRGRNRDLIGRPASAPPTTSQFDITYTENPRRTPLSSSFPQRDISLVSKGAYAELIPPPPPLCEYDILYPILKFT